MILRALFGEEDRESIDYVDPGFQNPESAISSKLCDWVNEKNLRRGGSKLMSYPSEITKVREIPVTDWGSTGILGDSGKRDDTQVSTKERSQSIRRTSALLSSVSTLAFGAVAALVFSPNTANAQCTEDTSGDKIVYNCSGANTSEISLSATANSASGGIEVNLSTNFTVTHASNAPTTTVGLKVSSNASISVTQSTGGGSISAAGTGVEVKSVNVGVSRFAGNMEVTLTGSVTSVNSIGVDVQHLAGTGAAGTVSVSTQSVKGKSEAIKILNNVGGGTTVSVAGAIISDDESGIFVKNANGTGTVSVNVLTSGSVSASKAGIYVDSTGGAVTLNMASGTTVIGGTYGIQIKQANNGNTTITATTVTGGSGAGIYASQNGSGNVSITTSGIVSTTVSGNASATGIVAHVKSGTLNIDVNAAVTGQSSGMYAWSKTDNAGSITIDVSGALTGVSENGLVLKQEGTGNISITSHSTISAAKSGISVVASAEQTGQTIEIDAKGAISATAADGIMVNSTNSGAGNITVSTAGVTAGRTGISVNSGGAGSVTISTSGAITSTNGAGIYAKGGATAGNDFTLNLGNTVTGSSTGVNISGIAKVVTINTSSNISATLSAISGGTRQGGIVILDAETVSITSSEAIQGLTGILLGETNVEDAPENDSILRLKNVTINSTGTVSATNHAIFASLFGSAAQTVSLSVASVESGQGIRVTSWGSGTISVDASGLIKSTATSGRGHALNLRLLGNGVGGDITVDAQNIEAANGGVFACIGFCTFSASIVSRTRTGDITIEANQISGGSIGVRAINFGSGNIEVTVSGAVSASSGEGIAALSYGGGDIEITTSGATGSGQNRAGIRAGNAGSGSITITTTGDVTSTLYDGIFARNYHTSNFGGIRRVTTPGNTIEISATSVTGGRRGIYVYNGGTGNTTITATGDVSATGTGIDSDGVRVFASNLPAHTASVEINVQNVTASGGDGIDVLFSGVIGSTKNITISAVSVTGALRGIAVNNSNAISDLSISATGKVTATNGDGLDLRNFRNLSLTVSGAEGRTGKGIIVESSSTASGNINISSSGEITGQINAISVRKHVSGDLTITATAGVAATGINTNNDAVIASLSDTGGSGNINLNLQTVRAAGGTAINANIEKSTGGNLTITATDVRGARGIVATSQANGNLNITATSVTGVAGEAIMATHNGSGAINITTTGAVSAGGTDKNGIQARLGSTGTGIEITVSSVTVAAGHGIDVRNQSSAATTITVTGGVTAGAEKTAINTNTSGNVTIAINGGAINAPNGKGIVDGAGNASVSISTGAIVNASVELGEGTDTFTFAGTSVGIGAIFDGGEETTDTSVDVLTWRTGSVLANNLRNWETIVFAGGATLSVANQATLVTNQLTMAGTLGFNNNNAGDVLNLTGNLVSSSGVMRIDVNFFAGVSDALAVTGNVTGVTTVYVTDVSAGNNNQVNYDINVITVTGTVSSTAFVLANRTFESNRVVYRLRFDQSNKSFRLIGGRQLSNCVESETILGEYLCRGRIIAQQPISKTGATGIDVTLDDSATVNVTQAGEAAFSVLGQSDVEFTQETGGGVLRGTGFAAGVLDARTTSGSVSVTLVGEVTLEGSGTAVNASSMSGGAVSVSVNSVSATHSSARAVVASGNGTNVTVSASGDISGGSAAIVAKNESSNGTTTIVTSSSVSARGGHGIEAEASGSAGGLTITVNDVMGSDNGILAKYGGNATITVSGEITTGGADGVGIKLEDNNQFSGSGTVILNRGALVTSHKPNSSGNASVRKAIEANFGATTVRLNEGATISGSVMLGAGVDRIIVSRGSFGSSILDGGTDAGLDSSVDELIFSAGIFTLTSTNIRNWERVSVEEDAGIRFLGEQSLTVDELKLVGVLTLVDNAPDDVFTVDGNFAGGGYLQVDIDFATVNSDLLILDGPVTGTTKIRVNDLSARNPSATNSVKVVESNSIISGSSFTLDENTVQSNEYIYSLTFNNDEREFWLNRKSTFIGPMVAGAASLLMQSFGRTPVAIQRTVFDNSAVMQEDDKSDVWYRVINNTSKFGLVGAGTNLEANTVGLQAGLGVGKYRRSDGVWAFGITGHYQEINAAVDGTLDSGSIDIGGFGIGTTATWFGEDGLYVDIFSQMTEVETDYASKNHGHLKAGSGGRVWATGIEFGKRYEMDEIVTLIPQGGFSWGKVDGDAFGTSNQNDVNAENGAESVVRVGIAAEFDWDSANGYLYGNLRHSSREYWDVVVDGKTFVDEIGASTAEFGFLGIAPVTETMNLFAEGAYSFGLSENASSQNTLSMVAGVRLSW